MPKGVEHITKKYEGTVEESVPLAVMPKGVEHSPGSTWPRRISTGSVARQTGALSANTRETNPLDEFIVEDGPGDFFAGELLGHRSADEEDLLGVGLG